MIHVRWLLPGFVTARQSCNSCSESEEYLSAVVAAADAMTKCLRSGNKILFFGNGGSAADAQHLAAELSGRFIRERPSLSGWALTTNSSALTAIGNDYSFEDIFARQLEGIGSPGDIAFAISTSGNSLNVVKAVEVGRRKKPDFYRTRRQERRKVARLSRSLHLHPQRSNSPNPGSAYLDRAHSVRADRGRHVWKQVSDSGVRTPGTKIAAERCRSTCEHC